MSQSLALAGPRGLYILELLEIDSEYEIQFASLLKCIGALLGKGVPVPTLEEQEFDDDGEEEKNAAEESDDPFGYGVDRVSEKLVETCATLESMMPVQWNTVTRNLLLEMPGAIKHWGENWVTGLFHIERLHILLRAMCHSKKSHMIGFLNGYRLFTTNQISWRFCTDYVNKPRPSSLSVKSPVEVLPKLSVPGT